MSKRPPRKRQKRTILSEEEYTATLNDIVERDYFPDLPDLRKQVAVLDRRAAGDIPGAVAVRRAARALQQHEDSLAQEEQEAEQNVNANSVRKVPRPLHRESVSGFHARVTSEDNAEFDATQRQEVNENRARLKQVFSLRITNGNTTSESSVGSETPLLASDKFNPSPHRIAATEWKNTETGTNGLFFNPPQHDSTKDKAARPKLLLTNGDNSTCTSERQLMPPPAPVRKSNDVETSTAIVLKQDMVEYIPKSQVEKRIEPSQTRFPTTTSLPPPPQALSVRLDQTGDDASSSTDYSTEASTDLDAPVLPLSVERRARAKRLQREQETLVSMTPQIIPGRGSTGNESPITTWGTVSATPMVLSGTAHDESSFCLPAETGRDDAARRAQAKLEKARRKMKQRKKVATTPLAPDRMTASLTPAARSLLNKSTRPASVRSRSAFGSSLRSSYTPQRSSSSLSVASVNRDHAAKATPRLPSQSRRADVADPNGNITDGLLKLSK